MLVEGNVSPAEAEEIVRLAREQLRPRPLPLGQVTPATYRATYLPRNPPRYLSACDTTLYDATHIYLCDIFRPLTTRLVYVSITRTVLTHPSHMYSAQTPSRRLVDLQAGVEYVYEYVVQYLGCYLIHCLHSIHCRITGRMARFSTPRRSIPLSKTSI